MEIILKTVTVMFKAYIFHDLEVPDDWEPTPENLNTTRTTAWEQVDLEVNRGDWHAETLEVDGESIELD